MVKKPSVSEWIFEQYPDLVITEAVWKESDMLVCGTAWMHCYSEKHGQDYVICYDDYEKLKDQYAIDMDELRRKEERERIKKLYK